MDSLTPYHEKRDFSETPEPQNGNGGDHDEPIFVIHKHDATSLHYDFRIEIDGVLTSWAVPKGPSTDPSEKRLAIETEDHPISYASFEGVIPQGQYGAGPVIIWDKGTYKNVKEQNGQSVSMQKAYQDGEITIVLYGEKLQGGYALVKAFSNKQDQWLLVKTDDEEADARRAPTSTEPASVISGKTLEEIQKEHASDDNNHE